MRPHPQTALRLFLWLLPCLAAFALRAGAVPAVRATGATSVRVGILLNQDAALIQSDGPLEAGDPATATLMTLPAGSHEFRPAPGGMEVGANRFGPVVRLRSANGWITAGPRRYRGLLELRRTPAGKVTVINELDVEEYLYGVLKMEVDPRWPAEALKAQAVAARTIAHQSLGRFAPEGYDLRASTDSQVYGGINAEDPRTTSAVDATRGTVLTHAGRPIFAAYHSDSGGATESSEFVWGQPYPYLRGVPDPYSEDSPARAWLSRADLSTLEARLIRAGRPISGLTGVAVAVTSPSGRALTVRLTSAAGILDLRATDLRQILGVSFLRSTLFTVQLVGGDEAPVVEFQGRGSGHGVGMSQWGARGQAALGRPYRGILTFYYSGVQFEVR